MYSTLNYVTPENGRLYVWGTDIEHRIQFNETNCINKWPWRDRFSRTVKRVAQHVDIGMMKLTKHLCQSAENRFQTNILAKCRWKLHYCVSNCHFCPCVSSNIKFLKHINRFWLTRILFLSDQLAPKLTSSATHAEGNSWLCTKMCFRMTLIGRKYTVKLLDNLESCLPINILANLDWLCPNKT